MKKFLLGLLIGATLSFFGTWYWFKNPQKNLVEHSHQKVEAEDEIEINPFDQFLGGNSRDLMDQQVSKMRKEFERLFKEKGFGFDSFGGIGSGIRLEESEDDQNFYYQLPMANIDKDSLKVVIKDRQIMISGEQKIEKETPYGKSKMVSSFSQNFALPEGVKEDQVKIEVKETAVLITVPKA
jgi:HSP20 family molecular chaperone IbpA